MSLPYGSKPPKETVKPTTRTVYLALTPNDDLLNYLYSFSERIEATADAVYIEIDAADLSSVAALAASGVGKTKQAARLAHLSPKGVVPLAALVELGLSPLSIERLSWLGANYLNDLAKWSRAQLLAYLGEEAAFIWPYLNPLANTRVALYTPPCVMTRSYDFDEPVLEPCAFGPVIKRLCAALCESLAKRVAARLELSVDAAGIRFTATRYPKRFVARDNLELLCDQALVASGALGLPISRVSLTLKGLYLPAEQRSLFKQKRLEKAVARVESRFPGALLRITETDPNALLTEFRYDFVPWRGNETSTRHPEKRPTQHTRRRSHLVGA